MTVPRVCALANPATAPTRIPARAQSPNTSGPDQRRQGTTQPRWNWFQKPTQRGQEQGPQRLKPAFFAALIGTHRLRSGLALKPCPTQNRLLKHSSQLVALALPNYYRLQHCNYCGVAKKNVSCLTGGVSLGPRPGRKYATTIRWHSCRDELMENRLSGETNCQDRRGLVNCVAAGLRCRNRCARSPLCFVPIRSRFGRRVRRFPGVVPVPDRDRYW